MSYHAVLDALEEGDYVTFNHSGGANARKTAELCVQSSAQGDAIVELLHEALGEWWRVIDRDGELVAQRDRDYQHADTPHEWADFDVIETIELIAE